MAFDPDVVTRIIADELERRGRGAQTALAEALGVRVQTVNKWRLGQTTPEFARWPSIEHYFGWPDGYIAASARHPAAAPVAKEQGRLERVLAHTALVTMADLERLRSEVREEMGALEARVRELESAALVDPTTSSAMRQAARIGPRVNRGRSLAAAKSGSAAGRAGNEGSRPKRTPEQPDDA